MIKAVADSHAIIWYLYNDSRLSVVASATFDAAEKDGDQIAISAITFAEIIYLVEKGRIDTAAFDRVSKAMDNTDAILIEIPFDIAVAKAMKQVNRTEVPDLPDRIIAATAESLGVPVISRDSKIQSSSITTIW